MSLPFVGPSYQLRSRTADVQRTIGMVPVPIEPANARSLWTFKDVPGLVEAHDLGGPIRGAKNVNGRPFVVAGNKLYELTANGTAVDSGAISSASGRVGMAFNTTQLVISDGLFLYVKSLSGGSIKTIQFPGKAGIDYINQYIVFVYRDSQQFGWTALGDATDIDALDFASAESSPDNIVGLIVDHRELLLLGADSTEDWLNTGSSAVFERNQGVAIEDGAASEAAIAKLDGSVYWLTASSRGQGAVLRLQGYQPQRVSTQAIEEMLSGLDLSQATAFTYEDERSAFYCLNVPGLETTLVFDAFTNQWHERAELVNGETKPWRATTHLFAFGHHLVGADDGKLYRLDPGVSNNAGDPLLRERVMPVSATPMRDRVHFSRFALDCDRGTGGTVQMRYSTDGGRRWSEWKTRHLGDTGVFHRTVQLRRLSAGRDLVMHVRCTDDVPFNPISGVAE